MLFDKLGAELLVVEVGRCLCGAPASGHMCPIPDSPSLSIPTRLPKQALLGQIEFVMEGAITTRISSWSQLQDMQLAPSPAVCSILTSHQNLRTLTTILPVGIYATIA